MRLEWRLMLILLALASGRTPAGTVELRASARVEAGSDVTLSHIARLRGEDAEALGDLVILRADDPALARGKAPVEIGLVRSLIDGRGVNWGLLTLRGGRCDVRLRAPERPRAERSSAPAPEVIRDDGTPTVRTFVERRLRETFGVEDPAHMRVRFEDRDADLLGMALEGRLVDAHTTGSSARVPISVSVYEGDRLLERRLVRAEVLVEREVCVLRSPVRRGERLTGEALTTERRWLATDVSPLGYDEAVGAEAKSPIEAGVVVEGRHVEAPIVVRRGGLVIVHYLSGPVILKTKARAMSDGRVGEKILFEALGTKRRLMARVDSADRAVVRRESGEPGLVSIEPEADPAPSVERGGVSVTRAD